jgi:DNA-binding NarL/FixJ family response regulator
VLATDQRFTSVPPIKVYVISDFPILLEGLQAFTQTRPAVQILGTASTLPFDDMPWGAETPDVVLLDLETVPDQVLRWLRHSVQERHLKVLLFCRREDPALQDQAMQAGALGLVDHRTRMDTLVSALEKVHRGEVVLSQGAATRMLRSWANGTQPQHDPVWQQLSALTQRELKILSSLLSQAGDPAKAIAQDLHISESTLRNHLTSIYGKMGVHNRHALMSHAMRHGIAQRLAQQPAHREHKH